MISIQFREYLQFIVDQSLIDFDYTKKLLASRKITPNLKKDYKPTPYTGYWVNKKGDIYSERRGIHLSPRWDKDGYREVTMMDGDETVSKTVHRLVADAWIPNPKNLPIVNHKNGNRDDNRVENLEWSSVSANNMKENKNNGRTYIYNGHRIDRKKSKLI